ncbi:MAG: c-type cytochrome [Chromatiaceae bacterium]|jgi:cytochrome c556
MKKLLCTALLATLASAAVSAATAFTDAKDAVDYRQSAFTLIRHNTGDIGEMLQGKVPFDAKRVQQRADALAAVAPLPWPAFSTPGTEAGGGEAKAEIWADFKDFTAKADKFQLDAKALQTAAQSGDQAKIKAAFATFRGNCKACHDKYKAD